MKHSYIQIILISYVTYYISRITLGLYVRYQIIISMSNKQYGQVSSITSLKISYLLFACVVKYDNYINNPFMQ